MARALELEELIEHFTLSTDERELLRNKTGATRLGFSLILKFLLWKGRFPRGRSELADEAVSFVARQVGVPASEIGFYDWDGRQIKRHRVEIREATGFRPCTVADADKLTVWLAEHVARTERRPERVRETLLEYCFDERIEPPERTRLERAVSSALHQAETAMRLRVAGRIDPAAADRVLALVAGAADDPDDVDGADMLAAIKADPGNISLNTLRAEVGKLTAIRAVRLPDGLFADVAAAMVAAWRSRAAVEAPSHLRAHPRPTTLVLLAALLYRREREITDTLVDLLIATVHRINARAEKRVVEDFVADLRRVSGKENILFRITEAVVDEPDGLVRDVVYPAVGGVDTLLDLLAEYKAKGSTFRQHKQRVFKASYTHHYRTGLIELIGALEFHSTNTVHRPVLDALALIRRYEASTSHATQYYARGETVPVDGVIPTELRDLLYRVDKRGRQRIQRTVYECGVFQTLREKLRCKEIWVVGADRWRNPDEDLPADFEANRAENYRALRKPLDPARFVDELREELHAELAALNDALPGLDWLTISERKTGAISLTPHDAAPEPRNLRRLKQEIKNRWGVVPLLDMLTETALRTGCLAAFTAAGTREAIPPAVLFERLLLVLYAYGTNTGIRAVAAGAHGHTEADLRYVRRRYLTIEAARGCARAIANATFATRQTWLWGEGSTAVASDSTHFSAFDQNIFTEWHSRYRRGKRGVLIYWHVEDTGAMAVHSQLISCSASEVHAMVEGAMRHGTTMKIESNYVDSHGQSLIGFGITRLLDFDLIARIKQLNHLKLYRPHAGASDAYPQLTPALTRPIRWDLIGQQYDTMMKYATAIRLGTATTEAILRRFTRQVTHPAYAAMIEVGRAQRSLFLARYLRDRDLQRETGSALNVVENFNGVNDYIHFGKSGELASNRREEQELSMLCLHILQSSLGFVNTLMIQDVLAEPDWADVLGDADRRGLTPLFHTNMTPYGDIQLNLDRRITLNTTPPPPETRKEGGTT